MIGMQPEKRNMESGKPNGEREAFRVPSAEWGAGPSALRLPPSAFRTGFTLVELLVTMIIISILAGITLGVLQKAHQAADTAKTRSMIARLHNQIMLRWEGYRTRRVPLNIAVPVGDPYANDPKYVAGKRLIAMRELMRLELPERYTDITDEPVLINPKKGSQPATGTAVWQAYSRRYKNNTVNNAPKVPTEQYEGAECLYMIITMNNEDDFAGAEQFKPKDSGDADGDGMLEFHDAWGQPIEFLRWAPGFISDLQPSLDGKDGAAFAGNPDQTANPRQPNVYHDPMDPMKLQKDALALFPLVYSGGLDRQSDIYRGSSGFKYQIPASGPNNPYATLTTSLPSGILAPIGAPFDVDGDGDGDDGSSDNITNHLIGLR